MSKVVVQKTSPRWILKDIRKSMHQAEYEKSLPKDNKTLLKLNLSWSLFYPSSSTSPWQLEGTIATLKEDGYEDILAVENKTVVTDPIKGLENNKWVPVLKKYGVDFKPLSEAEWVEYTPEKELLVLDKKVFDKVMIPELFIGTNIIHLPTIKTHGHSIMTGAMKNAFGGLLKEVRHHCHRHIHEVLVDLLIIQKEIHKGMFAVTDGTICGDRAGPRTMIPRIKNYILSSNDMVAIDAVSAKMMGFDPFSIPKIRIAHDLGLGVGDIDQIDVVGEDISNINFHFKTEKSPVIFFDQLFRSSFIEPLMFRTWFFNLSILASAMYHDYMWYPLIGKRRVDEFMKTDWGRLFESY